MIYTYGFCPVPPPDLTLPIGMTEPVQWFGEGRVGAIVERGVDFALILQDDRHLQQAVLTHDRVLTEVCQFLPVLPLSFGTRLRSEADLQQHLAEHKQTYGERLVQLVGRAEFLIKLVPLEPDLTATPLPDTLKGRDYFLAKKQRLQAQDTQAQQRQAELDQLIQAIATQYDQWVHPASEDGIERIYVLAPRSQAATLATLCPAAASPPIWSISLSPPLPPYHFV